MTMKVIFYSIVTASVLSFATSANAQSSLATTNPFLASGIDNHQEVPYLRLFDVNAQTLTGERYLGSSRTATFFFKKGVKNFEKGKLEKADQHFRAVLRADGSKGLDKATLHYLANINHKQGNEAKAKEYAQAYYKINRQF